MTVDHRQLGRELELFATDELLGAGLPLWLPHGTALRQELERYIVEQERRAGYAHVVTPPLGRRELYERSGHWAHYAEDMFPPMQVGGAQTVLRPMNCPHHILVYRSRGRSHRELPLRLAELGGMYRAERSGVVGGLSRVRAMTLSDGHVFCAPDQVAAEADGVLDLIAHAYATLGVRGARYRLSLRGEGAKYAGDDGRWDRSQRLLRDVLDARGVDYEEAPGEAAFYGPKLDVQVTDPAGREETLSTLQVDMVLPERFGLAYAGADGAAHTPVLLHRSVTSTLERLVAHLIERYAGAFPVWLAPVQVAVLPVGAASEGYAAQVAGRLRDAGLRVEVAQTGSLGARVRAAQQSKVPYAAVVGEREARDGTVALRLRDGRQEPGVAVDVAAGVMGELARRRAHDLWR